MIVCFSFSKPGCGEQDRELPLPGSVSEAEMLTRNSISQVLFYFKVLCQSLWRELMLPMGPAHCKLLCNLFYSECVFDSPLKEDTVTYDELAV